MCSAINKFIAVTALCAALASSSCTDKEKQGATELFNQTEAAIERKDFTGALVLLDTLDSRYRAQTDIRRQGMRLRAQAFEGIAIDSISTSDTNLAEAQLFVQDMAPRFKHVDSSVGLEGYYIPKDASDKVLTTSGIQPRVTDKGFFYIVANVQGKKIGLKALEFTDGAETFTTAAISPSRIISVEGSESASFSPEDIQGLGEWLAAHPSASKYSLVGSKSNVSLKLDAKLRNQLTECFDYARAVQSEYLARVKREKFERMLATARDQLANAPTQE